MTLRVNGTPLTRESIAERMHQYGLPEQMVHGMTCYLLHHVPVGSFLTALLSNDFMDTVLSADDDNRAVLVAWAQFLYHELPPSAWGDRATVSRWLTASRKDPS